MAHEYDPYALGSGLPLADTDATITKMDFRFDTAYSADACVAAITFTPDEEGEDQEQLYSCGKGWEPLDRGREAGHISGRPLNFNAQSNYGRFLAAAYLLDGFLDDCREAAVVPTSVDMLLGKRFHLGTLEHTTMNPTTKVESVKSLIIPTEYYPDDEEEEEEDEAPKSKKAPAKKVAAKKAAAKPASAIEKKQIALIEELEAEDEDLVAALRELAAESEDHESFMEAAMELEGVAESEVAQQVAMSSKAGSIWATREG